MEADERTSFSQDVPGFQHAWDSTSLGTLKDCPRKYQLSIVEGWRGKNQSFHLRFGTLYHRALEVYDHKISEGLDHDAAQLFAIEDLAEGCMDTAEDGTRTWWDPGDPKNYKTIPNLFRSVVWYLEKFGKNDPAQTIILANGKPGVELSFRFDAGFKVFGHEILYSGHLDRVVDFNNQRWVMDRKTTGASLTEQSETTYFQQYSPDNQMSMYSLAGKIILQEPVMGVIIDAAQIAVGFTRFARGFAPRNESQLDDWHRSNQFWINQAYHYAMQEYWPMNDKACHNYGGCQFRQICQKAPEVQHIYLASDFKIEKWDPLKVRGEI